MIASSAAEFELELRHNQSRRRTERMRPPNGVVACLDPMGLIFRLRLCAGASNDGYIASLQLAC
jgi:hypothetical protein